MAADVTGASGNQDGSHVTVHTDARCVAIISSGQTHLTMPASWFTARAGCFDAEDQAVAFPGFKN